MARPIFTYNGRAYTLICSGPGSNSLRLIITEYLRAGRITAWVRHPIMLGASQAERSQHRTLARRLFRTIGPARVHTAPPEVQHGT
jgi:hypothetical protein